MTELHNRRRKLFLPTRNHASEGHHVVISFWSVVNRSTSSIIKFETNSRIATALEKKPSATSLHLKCESLTELTHGTHVDGILIVVSVQPTQQKL